MQNPPESTIRSCSKQGLCFSCDGWGTGVRRLIGKFSNNWRHETRKDMVLLNIDCT
uniref:Uncharacterized protein n=1 Tax=Arundo donax TaxID=35708 RepID=A0A0A9EJ98_ARUDO